MLDRPQYGLLAFGNWFGEVNAYHRYSQQLVILSSSDGGATWQVEEHNTEFYQYEPAALYHQDQFLFVARDQTEVRTHKQIQWAPGHALVVFDTNLQNPRYVDTVDLPLNPLT